MTTSTTPQQTAEVALPPVRLRASTVDREVVARTIHDAVGLGMLDITEAEERLRDVYAARYCDQLSPLIADLPLPAPATGSAGWLPPALVAVVVRLLVTTAGFRDDVADVVRRHRVLAVMTTVVVVLTVLAVATGTVGDLLARGGADLDGPGSRGR